ncbi:MAG TPA: M48 family metallopeptidase [Terracidiphilus sp.]|jgi:STE24 endopeptidase|nr:M48 family metallopeptidase [Terracidiphilus sp.]
MRWGVLAMGVALAASLGGRVARAGQTDVPATTQANAPDTHAGQQAVYHLPPEKLVKAVAYSRERNIFHFVDELWGLLVLWLLLATGAAAGMEAWAKRRVKKRWVQGLLFFAALLVVLAVTELPMDMWAEHESLHYGISVQGWGSWFGDQGKALGLTLVLGTWVMLLFQWIVKKWPRRYWLGIWLVTMPLMVLGVFVSPWIEPLFNKYEPLSKNHAGLVAELEQVVERTGTNIPADRMFLMKASEKTNGLNAYVSGLGATKRIVVWDTTAGRVPDDVVMFVFGHESGHYVLNHIPKEMAGMAVGLFFLYWASAGFAGWLAQRKGAKWGLLTPEDSVEASAPLAHRTGFVVLLFVVSLASLIVEPASNAFSRHFEHEADVYGQEAIHGLVPDTQKTAVNGFNALGEAYLEDPNPSPFIEFWEYNHPSVKTRAEFAAQYNPWKNGGHGRFFAQ